MSSQPCSGQRARSHPKSDCSAQMTIERRAKACILKTSNIECRSVASSFPTPCPVIHEIYERRMVCFVMLRRATALYAVAETNPPEKASAILPGTVEKIIKPVRPSQPESGEHA